MNKMARASKKRNVRLNNQTRATREITGDPAEKTIRLLNDWQRGDRAAGDESMYLVITNLERMARRQLRGRQSIESSDLVSELCIRLMKQPPIGWNNVRHFYGICDRLMSQIIADHCRQEKAQRRGGGIRHSSIDDALTLCTPGIGAVQRTAIEEGLIRLRREHPHTHLIFNLHIRKGFDINETAAIAGCTAKTVRRHLTKAVNEIKKHIPTGAE